VYKANAFKSRHVFAPTSCKTEEEFVQGANHSCLLGTANMQPRLSEKHFECSVVETRLVTLKSKKKSKGSRVLTEMELQ